MKEFKWSQGWAQPVKRHFGALSWPGLSGLLETAVFRAWKAKKSPQTADLVGDHGDLRQKFSFLQDDSIEELVTSFTVLQLAGE